MNIGFIGAGQMARALAKGFVQKGVVDVTQMMAADCFQAALDGFQEHVPGVKTAAENRTVVSESDTIILAVKPQSVRVVSESLDRIDDDKLLISIVAGFSISQLSSYFETDRIIRVMPNTPCLIGQGASGFSIGKAATNEDVALVKKLLSATGTAEAVPESLLDAVTGLSGSGPAYVFEFIEALSDGGVKVGLPRKIATQLAAQTVLGAAAMVIESGEHPAVLKDKVASPAGTTISGLHALESGGMRAAVMDAVVAATTRSRELGGLRD